MNIAYNMDCMEYMKTVPDGYFDLAVVDPPYGDGGIETQGEAHTGHGGGWFERYGRCQVQEQEQSSHFGNKGSRFERYGRGLTSGVDRTGRTWAKKYGNKITSWDHAPGQEYFDELFRVSKAQVIWGGNYFQLPPCRCFLIWRKTNVPENFSMAMCEYAWTSIKGNAKLFEKTAQNQPERFHPTQKPVELYEWVYKLFAKPGDRILDTHLGSGSSRIAALNMGYDFVGTELDPEYFRQEEERFSWHESQQSLF